MRAVMAGILMMGIAAPAMAAGLTNLGYVGLRGSYVVADKQTTTSLHIDDTRDFSGGWGATGFVGAVLSETLRGEFEAGYRINDIDHVNVVRNTLLPVSEGSAFPVDGQVDMGLAMVNLYYDIHIADMPFLPWVGVGAGGAYVNYSITYDYGDPTAPVQAKDSDWQFAYQLMAGVTVPVAEATSISIGYRYFATEQMTFVDAYGLEFQTDLTNHSVDLGIQFHI